ncbi:MAG: hypothetical protein QM617_04470 [Comamonas sp.]
MTHLQRIAVWLVALLAVAGAAVAIASHSNDRQSLYPTASVQSSGGGEAK